MIIIIVAVLMIAVILLLGGKYNENTGPAQTVDHNKVTTLEKIAVLSVFRLRASPYEKYILDNMIEELEKEPEQ